MDEQTEPTLEQQLAEAEERGYRRGLNEQIAARMEEPGVWEGAADPAAEPDNDDGGYRILASPRRSVWD